MKNRCAMMISAALLATVFACSVARASLPPQFGGRLIVSIPDRVSKINPTLAVSDFEFNISSCIFETLVSPGKGGTLKPVLLETLPVVSDDKTRYFLKLRENVFFHDNNKLDAADVAHTIKKTVKNRKAPYSWIFDGIEGVDEYRSGKSGGISGVKITDPLRIEIKLKAPDKNFTSYLSFPAASIVPTSESDFDPPVGTGPFAYGERKARGDIVLVANKKHWNGRPYLDAIEFRVVKEIKDKLMSFYRGNIDVMDAPLGGFDRRDLEGMPVKTLTSPMKRMYFLDVNPLGPLGSVYSRLSLSSAIDRDGIVKVALNGAAALEINIFGKGDAAKTVRQFAGRANTIWYGESEPASGKVVDKLLYDFETRGLVFRKVEGSEKGIRQYSAENAPDIIFRSLPVLMGLQESVDRALFTDKNQHSRESSMLARLGKSSSEADRKGAVIMIFSAKRSYVMKEIVYGVENGFFGNVNFENAFKRTASGADN